MNTSDITLRLEEIFDLDQNTINDFKKGVITVDAWKEINRVNTEYVRGLLVRGVFPFSGVFSDKAYKAFFLVVQHSGDIELMKQVADSILKADAKQVDKAHYAYLIDRIRIFEGKPQLYGTQFKKEGGAVTFLDIEDIAHIDSRRAELGMKPFEEYRKEAENY